ncbi:s4 domain protein [Clostridium sp. CAG:433]|nr:s4 domain protein [Clostridium sp. CAG:433]
MIIIYTVEKIVEKVLYSNSTNFVEIKYLNRVKKELKNVKYNIYEPFVGATKVILYNKMPNIKIYEIISSNDLRHQDILGTLYSLNISDEMFGDVVIWNNRYFIIILSSIDNYIKSNLTSIKNSKVDLIERDPYYLKDYKQEYEECIIIVPSIRVDVIVSKIINSSRSNALEKIKNGDIYLNYELLTKPTYMLKENDIFSIRKYGKYKFLGEINRTKKGSLVIKYLKYV